MLVMRHSSKPVDSQRFSNTKKMGYLKLSQFALFSGLYPIDTLLSSSLYALIFHINAYIGVIFPSIFTRIPQNA